MRTERVKDETRERERERGIAPLFTPPRPCVGQGHTSYQLLRPPLSAPLPLQPKKGAKLIVRVPLSPLASSSPVVFIRLRFCAQSWAGGGDGGEERRETERERERERRKERQAIDGRGYEGEDDGEEGIIPVMRRKRMMRRRTRTGRRMQRRGRSRVFSLSHSGPLLQLFALRSARA